jgi:translation initiation factor IF-2
LGRADVRQTFRISKVGAVAGCFVSEGKLVRNSDARLVRDGAVVYTGKIATLRRFKDEASEVRTGFECGVTLNNFSDMKPGDIIEAYMIEKVQATLTS